MAFMIMEPVYILPAKFQFRQFSAQMYPKDLKESLIQAPGVIDGMNVFNGDLDSAFSCQSADLPGVSS